MEFRGRNKIGQDGLRFVMPDSGSGSNGAGTTFEWSATVLSSSRNSAWRFDSFLGNYSTATRDTALAVRCIGR
ncbi:MAG: hypothetical protein C5B49_07490 [Bdellovibrio sp.]|nr:MAG: hypothetical protein C5B49_07490 [Bdellovibrio sp.]